MSDWSNNGSTLNIKIKIPPLDQVLIGNPPSYAELFHALQKMVEAFDVGQEIKNPNSTCAIATARKVLARV